MFKFEQLDIWKESILFAKKVYKISHNLPKNEQYSLADQLRRAVSSVAANIAEGSVSSSKKDFSHYLDISIKSTYEVVSHLYLTEENGYIDEKTRIELYGEAEILVKKIKSFKNWLQK